jgi:hypothetical protein
MDLNASSVKDQVKKETCLGESKAIQGGWHNIRGWYNIRNASRRSVSTHGETHAIELNWRTTAKSQ